MKKGLIALVLIVAAGLLGYTMLFNKDSAPEVQYTSITGQQLSTSSLKGKVVLVNFWATSCPGCIQEMPELKKTHQRYAPQGYETVAVAMSYDPPNYVKTYVETNQLPFFITLDTQGGIAKAFGGVQLTPTSVLIDKQGQIVKRYVGVPDFAELNRLIEQKLKA
ncbi:peroxiredoxin [Pseudogulbenkiania sp. MAI-1]|uniref:peroxiredoxin family protein n=1 Tax=Pseudogulbenkiania sp. MAI-1 TaxID=990370 RepID=UPI00045EA0ED|nr:TlpA disulfide reductase family protein [Pseudogulbenkiania sp. MAI-1]